MNEETDAVVTLWRERFINPAIKLLGSLSKEDQAEALFFICDNARIWNELSHENAPKLVALIEAQEQPVQTTLLLTHGGFALKSFKQEAAVVKLIKAQPTQWRAEILQFMGSSLVHSSQVGEVFTILQNLPKAEQVKAFTGNDLVRSLMWQDGFEKKTFNLIEKLPPKLRANVFAGSDAVYGLCHNTSPKKVLGLIKPLLPADQADALASQFAVLELAHKPNAAKEVLDLIKAQPLAEQGRILSSRSAAGKLACQGLAREVAELADLQPENVQKEILGNYSCRSWSEADEQNQKLLSDLIKDSVAFGEAIRGDKIGKKSYPGIDAK
jgi:hypothetical protein